MKIPVSAVFAVVGVVAVAAAEDYPANMPACGVRSVPFLLIFTRHPCFAYPSVYDHRY
jgi:hypothetical protein